MRRISSPRTVNSGTKTEVSGARSSYPQSSPMLTAPPCRDSASTRVSSTALSQTNRRR